MSAYVDGMEYSTACEALVDREHRYIIVEMHDTVTGERRICLPAGFPWFDHSPFFWEDGNFGCDCNRSLVFDDWASDVARAKCGDGRYRLRITLTSDGREVYADEGFTPPEERP